MPQDISNTIPLSRTSHIEEHTYHNVATNGGWRMNQMVGERIANSKDGIFL